jgi:hypothetical protein
MNNILENINNLIGEIKYCSNKTNEKKDLKETEEVRSDIRKAWFKHFKSLGTYKWDNGDFS